MNDDAPTLYINGINMTKFVDAPRPPTKLTVASPIRAADGFDVWYRLPGDSSVTHHRNIDRDSMRYHIFGTLNNMGYKILKDYGNLVIYYLDVFVYHRWKQAREEQI